MTVAKPTNLPLTVLALLNGMFGGSIMVLPLLSLRLDWLEISAVVIITVLANWYSCYLVLLHLGNEKDVGNLVQNHLGKDSFSIKLYNIATSLGLLTACMVYFKLIVIQIEGLFLNNQHSVTNTVINGLILVLWCLAAKYCDVDTHLSGYGFASIAAYFLFLLWAALSRPSSGPPLSGTPDIPAFTAVMNNALTIQFIFVPIMKSYKQRENYSAIIGATFIITMLFYFYIDGVGAYSIQTRQSRGEEETIQSFFGEGEWQVKLIESIYLFHLYSVFPQYTLAAKKRVFHLFGKEEQGPKTVTKPELLYLGLVFGVAVAISLANINIKYIITFNGAVFGFIYCYLIPCLFHVQCAYLKTPRLTLTQLPAQQTNSPIQMEHKHDIESGTHTEIKFSQELRESVPHFSCEQPGEKDYVEKKCNYQRPSVPWALLDIGGLLLMMGLGFFVLVYQLKQLLFP